MCQKGACAIRDDAPLKGKVALVTGAGQGLGRAIAQAIVAAGGRVGALGRSRAPLDALAVEAPDSIEPLTADVADPVALEHACARLSARWGGIDILVNNAALYALGAIEEMPAAEIDATVRINLLGPIHCARAVLPFLRARGGGDIINISSESVLRPFPHLTAYAASKAGLELFAEGLRQEVRAAGIRVAVIRCGALVGSEPSHPSWTEARVKSFLADAAAGGHLAFAGAGIAPASVAEAVVATLALPRDASVDLLQLRSAGARAD